MHTCAVDDAGITIADVDGLNIVPGLDYHHGTRRYGYQLGIPMFWVGSHSPGARCASVA